MNAGRGGKKRHGTESANPRTPGEPLSNTPAHTQLLRGDAWAVWLWDPLFGGLFVSYFQTEEDADRWLRQPVAQTNDGFPLTNAHQGWRGPIPIYQLAPAGVRAEFAGPWLHQRLKLPVSDADARRSWQQRDERSTGLPSLDTIRHVTADLEAKGLLPSGFGKSPVGSIPLTQDQEKLRKRAIEQYTLPRVRCALGETWAFWRIEADAALRTEHASNNELSFERLARIAFELESALQSHRGRNYLSGLDIFNFWTSTEVHRHVLQYAGREGQVFWAELMSRIGSYAYEVRQATEITEQPMICNACAMEATGHVDRGRIRSGWLDARLLEQTPPWSDSDLAAHGGPSYNTIQRYRSGQTSNRESYVRSRIAYALKIKISEVPE